MKLCSTCRTLKPLSEFRWRNKSKGIYSSSCRICQQTKAKIKWHSDAEFRDQTMNQRQSRLDRNRQFLLDYMSDKACVECGESDVRCLDFDHIKRSDKKNLVTALIRSTYSIETIMDEISKCQILCANCHRKRTYSQLKGRHRGVFD